MVDEGVTPVPAEKPPPAVVNHSLLEGQGFHLQHTLEGHERSVAAVKFSGDGKLLATASADKTVRVWDVATGEVTRCLKQHDKVLNV
jgi:COMPASS component SWD3